MAHQPFPSAGTKKNPLSDLLALEALRLLSANIRTVCADGSDREARGAMLLGSTLVGSTLRTTVMSLTPPGAQARWHSRC